MQPATVLQNAECYASDGSCLSTTLEANQASLCTAEGLQIRGFARQAASIASTRQSNQKRNPRSVATKVTGVKVN